MNVLSWPGDVVELLWTTSQVVVLTLVATVKAILPMGVIPRKDISNKICLITGSGSGLGQRMALEFAKEGCRKLVLWDINEASNEETKRQVERSGVEAWTYKVDLSDRFDIARKAALVKEEVGNVDILVNNAGIVTGKKLTDCSEDEIVRTMNVNCIAGLLTTRHFLSSMIENNSGHIVTIASIAGKLGAPRMVDYCASKYGAVGGHEALTEELRANGASGVKTTLACPYYIQTGMFEGVETHAPLLLPICTTDYAVERIVDAVLTDRQELFFPRFLYLATVSFALFPNSVNALLLDYFKIPHTMARFTGRRVENNN